MRISMLATAIGLTVCAGGGAARADEGMWLPAQLPDIARELREAGYEGKSEDLADLARPPMNAVVKVGGATGAFVAKDGLVLTNHHVAFGVIQYNSGKSQDGQTRDLIKDGFIAAAGASELPANPDYRVLVTTRFDRITDRILAGTRNDNGVAVTGRAYYDATMLPPNRSLPSAKPTQATAAASPTCTTALTST